jgi:hypothetical protein
MSVRKPLERQNIESASVDVDALIDKGAKVKEDKTTEELNGWTYINLRIPTNMLKEIDESVSNRVGIKRTGWILESIHEKIHRCKT